MTLPILMADWPGREVESLVWLASFPRSGNTFTRILLANYYFATAEEAYDINALEAFISSDTSPMLWNCVENAPSGTESTETIWNARPAVIAHYRKVKRPQLLPGLKTHTTNAQTFGVSGFDFRPHDRIIYIVRHPLDLLLSIADFNGKDLDSALGEMLTPGYGVRNDRIGGLEVRGSWAEHVTSWVNSPPCPLFLLRYEELSTATEASLRAILSFLHVPIVEEKVRRAVAASHFHKLREQEEARSFVERPSITSSGRFFREGRSLQWLRKLNPEQAYRLADSCEKVMVPLGYAHPRDVMFDGRNALGPMALPAQNLKPDSTSSL